MVELALPILSTKSPIFEKSDEEDFEVVSSGKTQFPNDVSPSIYLDVIPTETPNEKYRFALNWTNQKHLAQNGIKDTDELHGRIITVGIEETTFKNKPTTGLRIIEVVD
jgi:hypothetical protein